MEHLLPRPTEIDFNASNLADAWKKWKQTMQLYLHAVMKQKIISVPEEKSQQPEEIIDGYITELRNLSSTCEFQDIRNGLMLYRLIDGIESNQVRDVLLQKGSSLKAIEICRADEGTKKQLQAILQENEIGKINKKKTKFYQKKVDRDSKDLEDNSEGGKDGKNKKCRFCGRIHRPKMCPAYDQECRKCKKKNHWPSCCQGKAVSETKQYVIETSLKMI